MTLLQSRCAAARALVCAVALASSFFASLPLPAQAQKNPHALLSKPNFHEDIARRPGESETAYKVRVRKIREAQDYERRVGTTHFDNFDDFIEQTRKPKPRLLNGRFVALVPQRRLADVYISTGTGLVGGELLARMTRLNDVGEPDTRFQFFSPGTPAAEAYAAMFGADVTADMRAKLSEEFKSLSVVVDDAVFFLRTQGDSGPPSTRPLPVLTFPPSHTGLIHIRSSRLDPYGVESTVRAIPIARGQVQTLYSRIGEPAVYATPPPGRDIQRLRGLAIAPFKSSDLSAILLEGNTDARRALDEGKRSGAMSIAADFSTENVNDATLMSRLKSEFQLRAKSGRVIAIIGHHESGRLFVRQGMTKIASISRDEILGLAETYDVEVILLGCQTAQVNSRLQGFGSTLSDVNSEAVIAALVRSAKVSGNWRDFLANLSSEDTPLVFGSSLRRGAQSSDLRRAELRQGKLADGRWYLLAVIHYRVKCAVVRDC